MHKKLVVFLILIFLTQLVGCEPFQPLLIKPDNKPKNSDLIKLAWQFKNYEKNDLNGISYPYTDVTLAVYGKQVRKYKIGSYMGNAWVIHELKNRDLPPHTVTACQAYWAGGGDDICVVRSPGKLRIKWRQFDEPSSETDNTEILPFKTIKVIKIPKDTKIIRVMK